jgi:hypothetical protein
VRVKDELATKYINEISNQLVKLRINEVTKQTFFLVSKAKPKKALKYLAEKTKMRPDVLYDIFKQMAAEQANEWYSNLDYKVVPLKPKGFQLIGIHSGKMYPCGIFEKEREAWVHVAKLKNNRI